jgi:hypothetical protein
MKRKSIFALVVVASFVSHRADAQIAWRVASVKDGKVRFTFAARPEVCGFGSSISRGGGNSRINWSSSDSPDVLYDEECSHSPVRIVLDVNDGHVEKLRTYVGGRWRPATTGVVDLGSLSVREATGYLLTLAAKEPGRVGEQAILPLTLADSIVVWPQLFRIARDPDTPRQTQRQAVFWLGQAAGDVVSPDRYGKERESEDSEVRKQAVFALSQRRNGEAVPALIQVAKHNKDPEVRRSALFWLGQSADPRAISLFEEILSR